MKKIVFFDMPSVQEAYIKGLLPEHEILCFSYPLVLENIPREACDTQVLSVFVCSVITKEVLNCFPNIELLITRSTGYDHVDCKIAKQRNIIVCNIPDYATQAVAEHAFALLLALSRKLFASYSGPLDANFYEKISGFELAGKTIGLVGFGRIGRAVAYIATGFSMKVCIYDALIRNANEFPDYTITPSLESLLGISDIISLHLPLTEKTHHIFNDDALAQVKTGVYLINTARGSLVQTSTLVEGLDTQKIAGAGLDVLEQECCTFNPSVLLKQKPIPCGTACTVLQNYYLMHHDRVVVTPHNAFNTVESMKRCLESTASLIKHWYHGRELSSQVRT